jgi:hypothetical protein
MLNKTITGLKDKANAILEERRLNALTLAVQLTTASAEEVTSHELFELADALGDYIETGYYETQEDDGVEFVEEDCGCDSPDPMELNDDCTE